MRIIIKLFETENYVTATMRIIINKFVIIQNFYCATLLCIIIELYYYTYISYYYCITVLIRNPTDIYT